jgi:hypothetical protein
MNPGADKPIKNTYSKFVKLINYLRGMLPKGI